MMKDKIGKLITHGVVLLSHEMETVTFLLEELREDIEVIPPSHTLGVRMADFWMSGVQWEMKSPQGRELKAVEYAFKNAARQSVNVIIDLRRTTIKTEASIRLLEKRFTLSRRVKRLKIITLEENIVDFRKKSC